jgi:hypothetical protein
MTSAWFGFVFFEFHKELHFYFIASILTTQTYDDREVNFDITGQRVRKTLDYAGL